MSPEFQSVISQFPFAFSKKVWVKAQLLLLGVICCPGSRTICNVLRTVGLTHCKQFHKYHRFLSRDKWSALNLSRHLMLLLVKTFVSVDQPLVFGIDETIERRWGAMINKRGIYRDAVRSSASHFVKCSGLRWMSMMLLTPITLAKKVRRHLGVETQRQWSDLAIERTTPILMALKSIICLLANVLFEKKMLKIRTAAWYDKTRFTFSDILAAVRQYIWTNNNFPTSSERDEIGKLRLRIAYLEQILIETAA